MVEKRVGKVTEQLRIFRREEPTGNLINALLQFRVLLVVLTRIVPVSSSRRIICSGMDLLFPSYFLIFKRRYNNYVRSKKIVVTQTCFVIDMHSLIWALCDIHFLMRS